MGLLIKLIVCPSVVILSDYLLASIDYASLYQAIIVGLVLAFAAHAMEVLLLRRGTLWMSTLLDLAAAILILFFSQFLLPGSRVLFIGAFLTAVLLTFTEYFQHVWLIRNRMTEKG